MSDTAANIAGTVNRSWKGIDRVYHEIARAAGLSDCAFWILYALRDAGTTMPQSDLSQVWLYSRQTVSSTLRQLEERDLITVEYATGSRRDKQIGLTEAGARFAQIYIEPAMNAGETGAHGPRRTDRDMMFTLIDHYADPAERGDGDRQASRPGHVRRTRGGPTDRRRAGRRHRLTQASPKTREDKER